MKVSNIKNSNVNENILSINYKIFIILLCSSCLYLFVNPTLKLFGGICISICFILCIIEIFNRDLKISKNKIWLNFLFFLFYNIILFIKNPTYTAIYSGLLQVGILFFVCTLSQTNLEFKYLKKIFKYGIYTFIVLMIPTLIVLINGGDKAIRMFDGIFSFTIYKILFPTTFFILVKSKNMLLDVIFLSIIFLLIGERTVAMCMYIIYIVYILLNILKKSKVLYKYLFYLTSIVLIVFPFIYVYIKYLPIGEWINEITYQKTGANFFSGRNVVWEIAFDYIKKSPFFGYGLGNTVLLDNGITLSTHNLYVYLLLQGGMVGTILFFSFMKQIWMSFFQQLDDKIVRLSASYFIGIMYYSGFELTLIVNSINISFYLWLVIVIGFIKINYNKRLRIY